MDENRRDNAQRIISMFEEGKKFTEEVLQENERLRLVVAGLRNEVRDLGTSKGADLPRLEEQLAELSATNRVLRHELEDVKPQHESVEAENRRLRAENELLRGQFTAVEEENRQFADRYVKVERQNSDLTNLYVASYRLHSTLDYEEVLAIIKEIVINMVGSECFGVYAVEETAQEVVLIAHEGLESAQERVPIGDGPFAKAARHGEVYAHDTRQRPLAENEPLACIPLKVGSRILGVIAIYRLLVQKDGLEPLDFEMFELLGAHAATALYAARLYTRSERKRNTLEGFIGLLRTP